MKHTYTRPKTPKAPIPPAYHLNDPVHDCTNQRGTLNEAPERSSLAMGSSFEDIARDGKITSRMAGAVMEHVDKKATHDVTRRCAVIRPMDRYFKRCKPRTDRTSVHYIDKQTIVRRVACTKLKRKTTGSTSHLPVS